jgi:hypothetical protein
MDTPCPPRPLCAAWDLLADCYDEWYAGEPRVERGAGEEAGFAALRFENGGIARASGPATVERSYGE